MTRLGIAVLAGLCAAAAVTLQGRSTVARRRLRDVLTPAGGGIPARREAAAGRLGLATKRRVAAIGCGLATLAVVGDAVGLLIGAGTAVVIEGWLSRLEPRAVRHRRARIGADFPLAADLLAALLLAGATLERATDVVAATVGGPLGERLDSVVAHLRLGADPATTWLALADEPALVPLARALGRASDSGAAVAHACARLAVDQREAAGWRAELAARRVGVRTAGPLGLCFLPAFILIGVVPTILGIVLALRF